ncbi:MAG: 3-oxoacyl-[acyl-carrier-protein] reductase [bacterium]|nr:3-oxoacyl-[acyl-carrier-protein] reductase [bacterium]
MNLTEKVAFITGAAQGIGKETALTLARLGARIIATDLNRELLMKNAEEFQTLGCEYLPIVMDVTNEQEVNEAVDQGVEKFQRIDILVNNAGITRDSLIFRMSDEAWDSVLSVNLKGAFHCIKAVARPMLKQKKGTIINVASVVGLMGNPGQANYSASKAGLIGLTKTVARELASRGITVNAVAPGYIDTEMTRALPEAAREKLQEAILLKRLGTVQDVAQVIAFLASDGASYITGQVINVNGGMYM